MHKFTGLLIAGATVAFLSGCTTYHQAESYVTQPIVKNVKKGMTRDQVHQTGGRPASEISMIHAKGTCETYIIGESKGKPLTYFVSYNDTGHVMNYGFQSCTEYDTDPQAPQTN